MTKHSDKSFGWNILEHNYSPHLKEKKVQYHKKKEKGEMEGLFFHIKGT